MAFIETETAAPVGTLQTDIFCEGCGYNLHSQVVTRDERLNLLVCRCPECGRFAAAGQGSTIGRVWLNRCGTFLLVLWVMFLFFGFGLATLFMGILPYSHLRNFTHGEETKIFDARMNSMTTRYYYAVGAYQSTANTDDQIREERVTVGLTATMAGILAGLVGVFHSVFFWHVKKPMNMFAPVFPLISFAGAAACWLLDSMSRYVHGWGMARLGGYFLLESICVLVGLAVGRPIARASLRWFIPPKPRQHLAFLWTIDGKKPPVQN